MIHVVAISGKRLSGKDTMADRLVAFDYQRMKFATELYREAESLGFTADQLRDDKEILRPILIAIGDARRHYDEDHYAKALVNQLPMGGERIVISDMRFKNEARLLREWEKTTGMKVTLVRVERPDLVRDLQSDRHKSECDLDDFSGWDLIVNANSGEVKKLDAAADSIAMPLDDDWAV